jgi:hypothetical protein
MHYRYIINNNYNNVKFLAANASTSLQTALAADAHLAEPQFLHEEHALNNLMYLIYRAGTRRPSAEYETRVNLSKKGNNEAMPPLTQSAQFSSPPEQENNSNVL